MMAVNLSGVKSYFIVHPLDAVFLGYWELRTLATSLASLWIAMALLGTNYLMCLDHVPHSSADENM